MTEKDETTPTLSPEEFFKVRFINLLKDLGENANKDPETIWLMGSLAGSIIEENQKKSWKEFKLSLSKEAFDRLLAALQAQGNNLAEQKKYKAAYAVETLAISIIAPTMKQDKHLIKGNRLLDSMIGDAIKFYRAKPATSDKLN
ncbi:MAG TPA: hypothetical protein ENK61_00270 [Devosia sp.]|nr:hypothetical protein [Devosia sp.]